LRREHLLQRSVSGGTPTARPPMIYFLYVPTESGHPEMSALTDIVEDDEAAVAEAGRMQYGGRAGYLFDGDRFVAEVVTAAAITERPALSTPTSRPRRAVRVLGAAPASPVVAPNSAV
jgi:hypothetical protein